MHPAADPTQRDPQELRRAVAELVGAALTTGGTFVTPGPHEPLLSSGLIDSMGLATLLQGLSDALAVDVEPLEVCLENFDTVSRISSFVEGKLPASGGCPGTDTIPRATARANG